ncbi:MAG: hypothetical protein LBT65_05050 [Synergistaceae bacterium]|jgi:hypothetical protein|nr:hypothetical protein [Synergistaceae bacterium]
MTELQCRTCGGKLVMAPDNESSECENCGASYTRENMREMSGAASADAGTLSGADDFDRSGEAFLNLREWARALDVFEKMTREYPGDSRGWWGALLAKTELLTLNPRAFEDDYKKTLAVATPEFHSIVKNQFEEYAGRFEKKLERLKSGAIVREKSERHLCYMDETTLFIVRQDGEFSFPEYHAGSYNDSYSVHAWFKIHNNGKLTYNYASDSPQTSWILKISDDFQEIVIGNEDGAYMRPYTLDPHGVKLEDSSHRRCYIATAVYGSCEAPEVLTLRRFRDEVLLRSSSGRKFVALYYRYSPPCAEKLKNHRYVNRVVKFFLDGIVRTIDNWKIS